MLHARTEHYINRRLGKIKFGMEWKYGVILPIIMHWQIFWLSYSIYFIWIKSPILTESFEGLSLTFVRTAFLLSFLIRCRSILLPAFTYHGS